MKKSDMKDLWTTPEDIRQQIQKLWDKGILLADVVEDQQIFPLKLKLRVPGSREMSEKFSQVRDWIARLSDQEGCYRLNWRPISHRILGANQLPAEIWIERREDALQLIRQEKAADRFYEIVCTTRQSQPELLTWLLIRPHKALELSTVWPLLLQIVDWLKRNPRPGIYLREISLPGVHTKLIESHRVVLAELLDLAIQPDQIDSRFAGTSGFNRRYGFKDKPARVRFRLLDPNRQLLSPAADQDITIRSDAFADLYPDVSSVFITENEINFLAFPAIKDAMIIFGSGYGFDHIAAAHWMHDKKVYYWGDIDTHGFAILHQLRGVFRHTVSLLMDRATLLAHSHFWVTEVHQEQAELVNLTSEEQLLYDDLRCNRLGRQIRLEQERIPFRCLLDALETLQ